MLESFTTIDDTLLAKSGVTLKAETGADGSGNHPKFR